MRAMLKQAVCSLPCTLALMPAAAFAHVWDCISMSNVLLQPAAGL